MLLRLIFWIIIFYILFRVLVRYILPFLVKYFVKKEQEKFYRQNPDIKRKKEGEISIDYVPENDKEKKKDKDDDGEYIDYEEI